MWYLYAEERKNSQGPGNWFIILIEEMGRFIFNEVKNGNSHSIMQEYIVWIFFNNLLHLHVECDCTHVE